MLSSRAPGGAAPRCRQQQQQPQQRRLVTHWAIYRPVQASKLHNMSQACLHTTECWSAWNGRGLACTPVPGSRRTPQDAAQLPCESHALLAHWLTSISLPLPAYQWHQHAVLAGAVWPVQVTLRIVVVVLQQLISGVALHHVVVLQVVQHAIQGVLEPFDLVGWVTPGRWGAAAGNEDSGRA